MPIILAAWKGISWCKAHSNMCMSKLQFIKNWSWERQGTVNSGVCLDFQICSIFFQKSKAEKVSTEISWLSPLLIWENISLTLSPSFLIKCELTSIAFTLCGFSMHQSTYFVLTVYLAYNFMLWNTIPMLAECTKWSAYNVVLFTLKCAYKSYGPTL